MGEGTASEAALRAAAPEVASGVTPAGPLVSGPFPTLPRQVSGRSMVVRLTSVVMRARSSCAKAWQRECDFGTSFLFVPVVIGAGVWTWYALPYDLPPLLLAAMLLAGTILAARWWHSVGFLSAVARIGLLFVCGLALAALETARLSTVLLDTPVTTTLAGRVLAGELDDRGRMRYRIAVLSTEKPTLRRPPAIVNLVARSRHTPISVGDGISGRVRLAPPSGAALQGLNDFAFDAYFSGTGAIGYFYGKPAAMRLADEDRRVSWLAHAQETMATWRSALTARIRDRIGGDAGAIAAALVTAEQRGISPATVEALRQAGLAHVLAISGLNMVLAAGTFLVGARLALALLPGAAERYPIKKFAAAGGLVTVTLYILISGGAVSAVRSWLMIVIMLLAVLVDRTAISLRNIALSAIVILAVTPSAVTGPGFQMSYAATLGLVAGYAAWRDRGAARARPAASGRRMMQHVGGFVAGLLLTSVIGGLATLAYSVGHFHRIPGYGLAGNLLAMPIISLVVMPMGVVAMLLMPLGLEGIPLTVMGMGIEAIIVMAHFVSGWHGEIVTGRLPPLAFAFLAAGGAMACLFRTRIAALALLPLATGTYLACSRPRCQRRNCLSPRTEHWWRSCTIAMLRPTAGSPRISSMINGDMRFALRHTARLRSLKAERTAAGAFRARYRAAEARVRPVDRAKGNLATRDFVMGNFVLGEWARIAFCRRRTRRPMPRPHPAPGLLGSIRPSPAQRTPCSTRPSRRRPGRSASIAVPGPGAPALLPQAGG